MTILSNESCSANQRISIIFQEAYDFLITPGALITAFEIRHLMPVGLQILGPHGKDAPVMAAAHAYQKAFPLTDRRPPLDS